MSHCCFFMEKNKLPFEEAYNNFLKDYIVDGKLDPEVEAYFKKYDINQGKNKPIDPVDVAMNQLKESLYSSSKKIIDDFVDEDMEEEDKGMLVNIINKYFIKKIVPKRI